MVDFWIRETGTGQQVAQRHERYMMMMMMMIEGRQMVGTGQKREAAVCAATINIYLPQAQCHIPEN